MSPEQLIITSQPLRLRPLTNKNAELQITTQKDKYDKPSPAILQMSVIIADRRGNGATLPGSND